MKLGGDHFGILPENQLVIDRQWFSNLRPNTASRKPDI